MEETRYTRNDGVAHGPEALPRRPVLGALAAAATIAIILCLVTLGIMRHLEDVFGARRGAALGPPHDVASIHATLFDPATPKTSLAEQQRRTLHAFGWVDRRARIVHVPIELAIDLVSGAKR